MNQNDFRHAMPPVPEHFLKTREQALLTIRQKEESDMKPSRKISLTVAIALIVALLLAAGAIAATQTFGILDFINADGNPLLEGSETAIQTALGSAETELFTASVEEAYFDGHTFAITVHYTAADPENDVLADMLGTYWHDDRFTTTLLYSGPDPEHPEQNMTSYETTHRDGKRVLSALVPDLTVNGALCGDSIDVAYLPDESLVYMLEGTLPDAAVAPAACVLRCGAGLLDDSAATFADISFTLSVTPPEETVVLVPEAPGSDWNIKSAILTFGRLHVRLDVTCSLPATSVDSNFEGVDVRLFHVDGTPIEAAFDGCSEEQNLEDGGRLFRQTCSLPALEEIPDVLVLRAKKIGSDEWLEPIRCRAVKH